MNKGQSILTKREKEIFDLLVHNLTTREIADQLSISEKTVRNHISNVILKLNVKGRSQAIVELLRLGELFCESLKDKSLASNIDVGGLAFGVLEGNLRVS